MSTSLDSSAPALTLPSLPLEILGRTSTYLTLTLTESDVWSFLLALRAGPSLSRTVKHWYLKGNAAYITEYVFAFVLDDYRSARSASTNASLIASEQKMRNMDSLIDTVSADLQGWMEINVDWKEACRPYGKTQSEPSGLLITDNTVLSNTSLRACIEPSESNHLTLDETNDNFDSAFRDEFAPGSIVVGIDGVNVLGRPYEEVKGMIEEAKDVKLMSESAEFFFTNPAFAIDLGLFDVLRFIAEDIFGVDFSRFHERTYGGLRFPDVSYTSYSPFVHALAQPDPRFFDYFLSLDGVDLNPRFSSSSIAGEPTLFHTMIGQGCPFYDTIRSSIGDTALLSRLKDILMSGKVDVGALNSLRIAPLYYLIYNPSHLQRFYNHRRLDFQYDTFDLQLAAAFLDAGASVADSHLNIYALPDRRGYRGTLVKLLQAENKAERDAIIANLMSRKRKR